MVTALHNLAPFVQCNAGLFRGEIRGRKIVKRSLFAFAGLVAANAASAQDFKLPPEVTPQLRAACETDVRRLCIGQNPTVAKVKRWSREVFSARPQMPGRTCFSGHGPLIDFGSH
jgi:hypothetical protein